jgi:exosome complex component CSL4
MTSSSIQVSSSSLDASLLVSKLPHIPTLRHNIGSIVMPGHRIGRMIVESIRNSKEKILLVVGPGTYLRDGQIYASILGQLHATLIMDEDTISSTDLSNPKDTNNINITQLKSTHNNYSALGVVSTMMLSVQPQKGYFAQENVIQIGQIILGRIIRIQSQQQQAVVSILAIQSNPPSTVSNDDSIDHKNNKRERYFIPPYNPEGIIRKDDIRTNIVDQQGIIQIQNSFHTNDIILAKVISYGTNSHYYLSTSEIHLGVIHAKSSLSGQSMIPMSYKEMQCPSTGHIELRKCAKPPPTTTTDAAATS